VAKTLAELTEMGVEGVVDVDEAVPVVDEYFDADE